MTARHLDHRAETGASVGEGDSRWSRWLNAPAGAGAGRVQAAASPARPGPARPGAGGRGLPYLPVLGLGDGRRPRPARPHPPSARTSAASASSAPRPAEAVGPRSPGGKAGPGGRAWGRRAEAFRRARPGFAYLRPPVPPAGDAGPGSALPPPFLSLPAAGERGGGGGLRAQPEVPGPGRPPRRHGALGSGAVAAAAEEALGSRRRLRALPRLLPHQHLQAGREDGERSESPPSTRARAADHVEGYICERKDLLVNGCCNVNVPSTKLYSCDSCLPNGCCSVYEYCVSCCLQPSKQHLLERFLNRAAIAFQNLFMAVEDHFELCLAKCRTSSQSVQHENTYRDPIAKYCYGEYPPELLPV